MLYTAIKPHDHLACPLMAFIGALSKMSTRTPASTRLKSMHKYYLSESNKFKWWFYVCIVFQQNDGVIVSDKVNAIFSLFLLYEKHVLFILTCWKSLSPSLLHCPINIVIAAALTIHPSTETEDTTKSEEANVVLLPSWEGICDHLQTTTFSHIPEALVTEVC